MSGRQVTYSLHLNSNVSTIVNQAEKDALRLDNTMWQLNKTLSSLGLGLGAHYLINAAKEWTQGAADYETALLRIKNASENLTLGLGNQGFITKEVDHFKLKLQESLDAYGSFLFKIKNAGLAYSETQRMYDNILTISKVAALPQTEIDATVRNMGIMLGEGILEARHLRMLSYVHPQIVPYLAKAIGLKDNQKDDFAAILKGEDDDQTAQQKLSLLMSSGKLTKSALPATLILKALEEYRQSVQDKLPETLNIIQSNLNDLDNTWVRFKNNLILDNKPELLSLFEDLKKGIGWLIDHEEGIIRFGKEIVHLAEAYALWRLSIVVIQAPLGILGFFAQEKNRLTSAFEAYNKKAAETISTNTILAESEVNLEKSETNAIAIIEQEQAQLELLKKQLTEVSVQTDLFTESQIANTAASEKLKDVYIQLDMFSNDKFRNFGIGNAGTQASLNKYRTTTEDLESSLKGATVQGELFTTLEIEMSAAMKSTGDYTAILNEELSIQNKLLAERQAILDREGLAYDAMLAKNVGYAAGEGSKRGILSKGMGFISDMTVPVMITWIANDVLNAMFPRDKDQWKDNERTHAFGMNLSSAEYNDLYEDMILKGYVDFNHPKFNGIAQSDPFWMTKEEYANRTRWANSSTTDDFAFDQSNFNTGGLNKDMLDRYGIHYGGSSTAKKDYKPPNLKDTSHIKGNSVTNINIHINELNGVKQYSVKVDESGNKIQEEKIAEMVGLNLVKILTGVVNDSQLVGNHK